VLSPWVSLPKPVSKEPVPLLPDLNALCDQDCLWRGDPVTHCDENSRLLRPCVP
jgi:hypothetical protein